MAASELEFKLRAKLQSELWAAWAMSSSAANRGPSTPSNSSQCRALLSSKTTLHHIPTTNGKRIMSRALDASVKEALKKGDHKKVYNDISDLLTPSIPREPLEIEMLGSSHPLEDGVSYIQDEADNKFVAIPKLRIVQAFIVARQKFFTELNDAKRSGRPLGGEVVKSTAVMLLMDPEHLTAANARKRVIKHSTTTGDVNVTKQLLQLEMLFLRTLLTSRLHRHTKSPTLWSHRRWLVDQAKAFGPSLEHPLTADLVEEIFISAERHPRNYYAWSHARHLVGTEESPCDVAGLATAMRETKTWCFKHHDDVSGWMYLLFVLGRLQAAKKHLGWETPESDTKAVFDETVNLVKSFRWRNESVWYFLRNLVSSELTESREREIFYSVLRDVEKGATPLDAAILSKMGTWIEQWSSRALHEKG